MNYNILLNVILYTKPDKRIKVLSCLLSDEDFKYASNEEYYINDSEYDETDRFDYLEYCQLADFGESKWNILMNYYYYGNHNSYGNLYLNKWNFVKFSIEHQNKDMANWIIENIDKEEWNPILSDVIIQHGSSNKRFDKWKTFPYKWMVRAYFIVR